MISSDIRPWGFYEVLYDGLDCKVKRIIVNSSQKLSYQYHHKRSEQWIIVSGTGVVKLDGIEKVVNNGHIVEIPVKSKHSICNTSPDKDLVFIEVQTGEYFGEDDIVRLQDDYGRV